MVVLHLLKKTHFVICINLLNQKPTMLIKFTIFRFFYILGQSYPLQDEPEIKSHAANILSNNLSLSNCTFLAISLSVYLFPDFDS